MSSNSIKMANGLWRQIVEEALQENVNFSGVLVALEQLIHPVNIVPNPMEVLTRKKFFMIIPRYSPDDFWCHFRMSRATFRLLLNQLPRGEERTEYILLEKKLLFSIWILAKPESFVAAGDRFDLAAATDIPGIIGAIDGCHIAIKAPPNNGVDYYNRNVFGGTPGRVHDARLYLTSPVFNNLTENWTGDTISPTEHLLGDSAYPLSPFLLTPYRDNEHLTVSQVTFNTRMSSYLEMARIDMVPAVIAAACVLHNIILRNDGIIGDEPPEAAEHHNINMVINEEINRNALVERKRNFIAALITGN